MWKIEVISLRMSGLGRCLYMFPVYEKLYSLDSKARSSNINLWSSSLGWFLADKYSVTGDSNIWERQPTHHVCVSCNYIQSLIKGINIKTK
jgi:hypothetical protein